MAEEKENTSTEENMNAVQQYLREQFDTYKQEFMEEFKSQQTPTVDPVKQQNDLIREAVNPFIEPGLNQAKFLAGDAIDRVDFYTTVKDAADYKDQVEAAFTEMAKAGRPTKRSEILKYLKGKEYEADPDAFIKKHGETRQKELDRIASAVDFGGNSGRLKEDHPLSLNNFKSKTVEEMEKALEGYTF